MNYDNLDKKEYIELLKQKDAFLLKAQEELALRDKKIDELSLMLAMNKQRVFGVKSESIDKEERDLFNFNELEDTATTTLSDEVEEIKVNKERRAKSKNHSSIDFESRVSETIIHENNKCCNSENRLVKDEVIYKAEVNLDIKIIKHVYKTTVCDECNKISTPLRDQVFNNSIATPSLVSFCANEKYLMGTPLYRQEAAFLNAGFPLSRVDISNYLMKGAAILKPLDEYMRYLLINNNSGVIHADETTLKVIKQREKRSKSYVWLYTTSRFDEPIYIYEYKHSREGKWPREFLKDFKGYLVCDNYGGYNHIPNVVLQRCFIHARRYFFDIYKANKDPKAYSMITMIDQILYKEKEFRERGLSAERVLEERKREEFKQMVMSYFEELEKMNYSPTSSMGKAVNYSVSSKKELTTFFESGYVEIQNNIAERGIKPFVINRKNFLFSNTEKGAEATCIYMSIIQSAKASGLDTNKYLAYLFEYLYKARGSKTDYLNQCLPWNEEMQKKFKVQDEKR